MRFEYDWHLIEEAVFREMRQRETGGKVEDYLAYRRSLDRIYEARRITAPDVESGAVTRPEPTHPDGQGVDEALRREHLACSGAWVSGR